MHVYKPSNAPKLVVRHAMQRHMIVRRLLEHAATLVIAQPTPIDERLLVSGMQAVRYKSGMQAVRYKSGMQAMLDEAAVRSSTLAYGVSYIRKKKSKKLRSWEIGERATGSLCPMNIPG
ncbi:hypothetical protein TNCV_45091 [Trichonephila clavipes]|nr:hypothetical protein TNCV_45091 [Trichonephila clavipes]